MISPEPFSVRSERTGALHGLTPRGELDIATAPALRHEFETVFSDGAVEMIVVDLTELAFLDSTGIRLLLEMNEACETRTACASSMAHPPSCACSTSPASDPSYQSSPGPTTRSRPSDGSVARRSPCRATVC